jgi:hypothetical protein
MKNKIKKPTEGITHIPGEKRIESLDEYDFYFPLDKDEFGKNVRENALDKAWEVRDFEIKLYWERAKYFWAFIASTFAAYFVSLGSPSIEFPELPFIVIVISIIFSLAWTLVNIGSKKWQENWEAHIDNLEDNFTGPLYRVVLKGKNYSVSKVNIVTSIFIIVIWFLLAVSFFIHNDKKIDWFIIVAAILIASIFAWILLVFTQTGRSKKKNIFMIREK